MTADTPREPVTTPTQKPRTEAGRRLWEHWTDLTDSPTVDLWWRQTIVEIEAEARAAAYRHGIADASPSETAKVIRGLERELSEARAAGLREAADGDVARLRRQNHEAAAARDRETAGIRSRLAAFENAAERARELVRDSPVDWTNDPPSKEPDGWWSYTSEQNRQILTTAVHAALLAAPGAAPAEGRETAE